MLRSSDRPDSSPHPAAGHALSVPAARIALTCMGIGTLALIGAFRDPPAGVVESGAWAGTPTLVLAGAAALVTTAVALTLVFRAPTAPGAIPLALAIQALALLWGLNLVADPGISWLPAATRGAGVLCMVLAGFGITRFSTSFPAPLTREEILRILTVSRPVRDETGARDRPSARLGYLKLIGWAQRPLPLPESVRRVEANLNKRQPRSLLRLFEARTAAVLALAAPALVVSPVTGLQKLGSFLAITYVLLAAIFGFKLLGEAVQGGDARARAQALWIVEGGVLGSALVLLVSLSVLVSGVFLWDTSAAPALASIHTVSLGAAALVFAICLAIAVFWSGSLDPALAIRRTTAAGLIGTGMTTLFIAVEGLISSNLVVQFGLPNQSGAVAGGVAAALVFGPLRARVNRLTSRFVERLQPASILIEGARAELAIVFCDLVGFTGRTAEDERAALLLAGLFHKEARRSAEACGGRMVKTIGDAVLLTFAGPEPALEGVRRLRSALEEGCLLLDLQAAPFRVGLHFGEAVVGSDGDLHGASVNLAARLQGAAEADSVLMSADAYGRLPEEGRLGAEAMGEITLRNVPEPVAAYRFPLARPAGGAVESPR